MAYETITVDVEDHISIIKLNRPDALNALNQQLLGELMDAFKRKLFYGKELDVVNVKEEVGDLMWYVAILLRELDLGFQELLQLNIDKLKARFPEKFTESDALNRDLDKERMILEGKS